MKWAENSRKRKYENDWVVNVLCAAENYELGYDYTECGICKLCRDEGCPELAGYLCRLDFVLADIMGMKLERTETIAEGGEKCDFRYSRK
ncbi:MAG: L-2-amino-thiazoline-4-carboxylic acid hydrolase [Ruminococcus sp.]|nr:L-2-amino-thiazoline-4-carboxylic acid hydrolase [Ruminococcus sp.]